MATIFKMLLGNRIAIAVLLSVLAATNAFSYHKGVVHEQGSAAYAREQARAEYDRAQRIEVARVDALLLQRDAERRDLYEQNTKLKRRLRDAMDKDATVEDWANTPVPVSIIDILYTGSGGTGSKSAPPNSVAAGN